jgi:hypothetical protein
MTTVSLSANLINSMMEYLISRKRILESLIEEFKAKYGSLNDLREKIEREGVPEDDHTIWDDLIMWENLDSELKKINAILKGLEACSTR